MGTTVYRILLALVAGASLLGPVAASAAVGSESVVQGHRVQYRLADERALQDAPRALKAAAAFDDAPVAGRAAEDVQDVGDGPRWLWVLAGLVGIGFMANGRMR